MQKFIFRDDKKLSSKDVDLLLTGKGGLFDLIGQPMTTSFFSSKLKPSAIEALLTLHAMLFRKKCNDHKKLSEKERDRVEQEFRIFDAS